MNHQNHEETFKYVSSPSSKITKYLYQQKKGGEKEPNKSIGNKMSMKRRGRSIQKKKISRALMN
jgi:hypothetical protein